MHACMYVCMYVCMYKLYVWTVCMICMNCIYVCMYEVYVCMHACMYVYELWNMLTVWKDYWRTCASVEFMRYDLNTYVHYNHSRLLYIHMQTDRRIEARTLRSFLASAAGIVLMKKRLSLDTKNLCWLLLPWMHAWRGHDPCVHHAMPSSLLSISEYLTKNFSGTAQHWHTCSHCTAITCVSRTHTCIRRSFVKQVCHERMGLLRMRGPVVKGEVRNHDSVYEPVTCAKFADQLTNISADTSMAPCSPSEKRLKKRGEMYLVPSHCERELRKEMCCKDAH
jgi:hypothetical protein